MLANANYKTSILNANNTLTNQPVKNLTSQQQSNNGTNVPVHNRNKSHQSKIDTLLFPLFIKLILNLF